MYIEVIKTSKITIFQPTYSSSGSLVARAPPDRQLRVQVGQDTLTNVWGHSHTPTLLSPGHFRKASSFHVHNCWKWEETRVGEKPHPDVGETCKVHTNSGQCPASISSPASVEWQNHTQGQDTAAGPVLAKRYRTALKGTQKSQEKPWAFSEIPPRHLKHFLWRQNRIWTKTIQESKLERSP